MAAELDASTSPWPAIAGYHYRTSHTGTSVHYQVHVAALDLTVGSVLCAISASTAMPRELW